MDIIEQAGHRVRLPPHVVDSGAAAFHARELLGGRRHCLRDALDVLARIDDGGALVGNHSEVLATPAGDLVEGLTPP